MRRIIESGLVKEAGIFAGAWMGVQLFGAFQKPPSHECLEAFPRIRKTPLARLVIPLARLEDSLMLETVLKMCDEFARIVSEGTITTDGFNANRLASDIPMIVEQMVQLASRSRTLDVAVCAMDYMRDELPNMKGVCENMIRNFLLENQTYA